MQRAGASATMRSLQGVSLEWSLSISHSCHGVLAAVAPPGVSHWRGPGVQHCQSRPGLRSHVVHPWRAPGSPRRLYSSASTIWAAKEAAYKASNHGEPFAPRRMCIRPLASGELACRSSDDSGVDCRITCGRHRNRNSPCWPLVGRPPGVSGSFIDVQRESTMIDLTGNVALVTGALAASAGPAR